MKKNLIILAVVGIMILASSCSSVNSFTSRQIDVERYNIQATPLVVDVRMDLSKKISIEKVFKNKTLGKLNAKESAMEATRYECINSNNIDIIVDPIYKVVLEKKKTTVSLTGYAGYYENPRTVTKDIENYKNTDMEGVKKYFMINFPQQVKFFEEFEMPEK